MGIVKDISGQRFGKLVVKDLKGKDKHGKAIWNCNCDCGGIVSCLGNNLSKVTTTSCGCVKLSILIKRNTTHGQSNPKDKIYVAWKAMKNRVSVKKEYTRRGIRVCCGYAQDFLLFKSDMDGVISSELSVDRIDNDKHYSCGKCQECIDNSWNMNIRWATMLVQNNNRSDNKKFTYNGETLSVSQWSKKTGIERSCLRYRLMKLNWSIEEALNTPAITKYRPDIHGK